MTRDRIVEILTTARGLIETPDRWTQGDYRVGGAICASEALRRASGEIEESSRYLNERPYGLLAEAFGSNDRSVCGNNDVHSHTDVLKAFDRAIEAAKLEVQSGE